MTFTVDRRIAELLCSRICHELVAGVAAINNGVELISEIDPGMYDEAMELIGSSAKQASARVQYYRMAYGFAGYDALPSMAAVTALIAGLTEVESRYEFDAPAGGQPIALQPGWGKLLLNMSVLAMECLPKGGSVAPAAAAAEGGTVLSVVARGEEARIPDRYRGLLDAAVDPGEVSALNVHAFYTAALAEAAGGRLDIEIGDGTALLRVRA
jgi:histidine phosphotransferase ChpT